MPVTVIYEDDEFDMLANKGHVWFRKFRSDGDKVDTDITIPTKTFEKMMQEYDAWKVEQEGD